MGLFGKERDLNRPPEEVLLKVDGSFFQTRKDELEVRLDHFLGAHLTWRSRSSIQRLIKDRFVYLDAAAPEAPQGRGAWQLETRPGRRLLHGTKVKVVIPPDLRLPAPDGPAGPVEVLLEDEDLLVVDKPPLVPVTRRAMDVMRAFPELIIPLFLIFVLGTSPVPAMIAVAFHTAGALGKLFSEVNENIDHRPLDGLQAVGAGWLQRMRFGVLTQVLPNYASYFLLRLEINVRASAILGFVGAGGIGSELRRTIGWGQGAGDETAALFVLLFLSIVVIHQMSSATRNRLVRGPALA